VALFCHWYRIVSLFRSVNGKHQPLVRTQTWNRRGPDRLRDLYSRCHMAACDEGISTDARVTIVPLTLLLRNRPPVAPTTANMGAAETLARRARGIKAGTLQMLLMIAGVACCVAMSMPQVHIIPYTLDLGFSAEQGAEMLSLMLAGGVVSRIVFGLIADRLGGLRTCLLASGLQCLALLFFLPFNGLAALYALALLFGLSQGGIVPSYAIIVREYLPAKEAGERVGLVIMCTIFGMALGGYLSGLIYDASGSYRLAFVNGIGWNVLNIAILGALTLHLFRKKTTLERQPN